MFKNFKGITLLALVVTIVVLLILAGVTIATLTGDNGLITRAQEAKDKTEQAEKEEKEKLGDMEDILNEYATGIKVEQVTDENPWVLEGTGTDSDPYTINSIEDLVFFAYDVTNGNTYEGDYVNLGLSLDFNSTKSYVNPLRTDCGEYGYNGELKTLLTSGEGFKTIGTENNENNDILNFYGTFDGNNHTIYNLYINKEINEGSSYQFYGLFAANYGIIKNLNVSSNMKINVHKNNVIVGGIAGLLATSGIIENCTSEGNIKVIGDEQEEYVAVGGIAGQVNPSGTITQSVNRATISGNHKSIYIGGIIGSSNKGNIYKSYNTGSILLTNNEQPIIATIGGIAGRIQGIIDYCFNIGEVTTNNSTNNMIGGLVGLVVNTTSITNSIFNNNLEGIGHIYPDVELTSQISKEEHLTEAKILEYLMNAQT